MALLNRFSKLNDRGETGIFTFIVTKSVTRDFHRDATTKDFCFGYHRWAISFQRPTEKVLGVHLLLRNASPNTACVVDFTLTLLNREHFSQNQVYSKKQAKFTITNPMQGVSRWIQMSDLVERRFSNETGEFLFELSLSNMTTIFECDIQLAPSTLNQYKSMLARGQTNGNEPPTTPLRQQRGQTRDNQLNSGQQHKSNSSTSSSSRGSGPTNTDQLINLETNCFTFGAFDWSLTIVPLFVPSAPGGGSPPQQPADNKLAANGANRSSGGANVEPVCRVYLNRLTGFDTLCRVKYRVILGHHQAGVSGQSIEFVDSKTLDQISDTDGRIRGYQFRNTNILKLVSVRSAHSASSSASPLASLLGASSPQPPSHHNKHHHHHQRSQSQQNHHNYQQASASVDLRVHIEMFCANSISEAKVALHRKPNELQLSNCSDRNKQAWCVESDDENGDTVRLKLFFLDLQSVPRNHIRYISWIAYLVRRDSKSGLMRDSIAVKNSPHSNYYLQDGIDMGTIMETDVKVRELNESPQSYLDGNTLVVHIEWIDSLLLFSHLYNNYDALATVQRHQISRELDALYEELEYIEAKHDETCKTLERLMNNGSKQGDDSGESEGRGERQTTSGYETADNSHRRHSGSNNDDTGRHIDQQRQQRHSDRHVQQNRQPSSYMTDSSSQLWSAYSCSPAQNHTISNQLARHTKAVGAQEQSALLSATTSLSGGAATSTSGYQSKPASPIMSYEERFKLSASTPPFSSSGSSSASSNYHHHYQQQQQHFVRRYSSRSDQQMIDDNNNNNNRSSSSAGNSRSVESAATKLIGCQKSLDVGLQHGQLAPHLALSPSIRRRLPQQPSAQGKTQYSQAPSIVDSLDERGGGGHSSPLPARASSSLLATYYQTERQIQLQQQASWSPRSLIGGSELSADNPLQASTAYQQLSLLTDGNRSRGSLELDSSLEMPSDSGNESASYFGDRPGARSWLNPAGGYKASSVQVSMDPASCHSLSVAAKSISSISFDATANGLQANNSDNNPRRQQLQQLNDLDFAYNSEGGKRLADSGSPLLYQSQHRSSLNRSIDQATFLSFNRSGVATTTNNNTAAPNNRQQSEGVGGASQLALHSMAAAHHHQAAPSAGSHLLFGQLESGSETAVIFDPIESSSATAALQQINRNTSAARFSQQKQQQHKDEIKQHFELAPGERLMWTTRMAPDAHSAPAGNNMNVGAIEQMNSATTTAAPGIKQFNELADERLPIGLFPTNIDTATAAASAAAPTTQLGGGGGETNLHPHRRLEYRLDSSHSLDEADADGPDRGRDDDVDARDNDETLMAECERARARTPIDCAPLLGAAELVGQLALDSLENETTRNSYQSSVRHSG